jgi:hypothetical protein
MAFARTRLVWIYISCEEHAYRFEVSLQHSNLQPRVQETFRQIGVRASTQHGLDRIGGPPKKCGRQESPVKTTAWSSTVITRSQELHQHNIGGSICASQLRQQFRGLASDGPECVASLVSIKSSPRLDRNSQSVSSRRPSHPSS